MRLILVTELELTRKPSNLHHLILNDLLKMKLRIGKVDQLYLFGYYDKQRNFKRFF